MKSEGKNWGEVNLNWPAKESRQPKKRKELDPSGWNKEELDKIESQIMESENKDKNNEEKKGMSRKEFLLTVAGFAAVAGGVGKFIKWYKENQQDIQKEADKIEKEYETGKESMKEKEKVDSEIRKTEEAQVQKAQEEGRKTNEKIIESEERNLESD